MTDFNILTKYFKAMSDPIRLKIINMLSCEEMCACKLLESLSITQPTLSHHMKVLIDSEIVNKRKDATWSYYSLNRTTINNIHLQLDKLTKEQDECICKTIKTENKSCNIKTRKK